MPLSLTNILLVLFLVAGLWAGSYTLARRTRAAAWGAGSVSSSALLLIGVVVVTSVLVPAALLLLPMWAALATVSGAHLQAAREESRRNAPVAPLFDDERVEF